MPINKLAHFSVRTTELDRSRRFYCDILGFKEGFRPPFDFPGLWLYRGGDEADYGTIHLIGVDPDNQQGLADYLGEKGPEVLHGSASVDHIAFLATNLREMRERLAGASLNYRERTVPSLELHQVFVEDPSGITIELNYPAVEAMSETAHTAPTTQTVPAADQVTQP